MRLFDFGTFIAVLLGFMTLVVVGVTVTGESEALCEKLGGVYTPENNLKGLDVCPGGNWGNLFKQPTAQPQK